MREEWAILFLKSKKGVLTARCLRKNIILQLVTMLATSLVGTNVPEVKIDHKEWDPLDFDARLFVAGAAAAYPELYQACLAI